MRRFVITILCSLVYVADGKILPDQDFNWVKEKRDDRLYLDSRFVSISDHKIFVQVDCFNTIVLDNLAIDQEGLYTRIDRNCIETAATVYPIVWCRNCRAWRLLDVQGSCAYCRKSP